MIEPALTRLHWKEALRAGDAAVGFSVWGQTVEIPEEARHATAALALHGQPYGFEWADVDALRAEWEEEWSGVSKPNNGDPLISIADRIAALLPPRDA